MKVRKNDVYGASYNILGYPGRKLVVSIQSSYDASRFGTNIFLVFYARYVKLITPRLIHLVSKRLEPKRAVSPFRGNSRGAVWGWVVKFLFAVGGDQEIFSSIIK